MTARNTQWNSARATRIWLGLEAPDGITGRQSADPDCRNAVSRRIVEVTDEDENLIPEVIALDPGPFMFGG